MVENISQKPHSQKDDRDGFPDPESLFYELNPNSEWDKGWDASWMDQEKSNPLMGLEERAPLLSDPSDGLFERNADVENPSNSGPLSRDEAGELKSFVLNSVGQGLASDAAAGESRGEGAKDLDDSAAAAAVPDPGRSNANSSEDRKAGETISEAPLFQGDLKDDPAGSDSPADARDSVPVEENTKEKNNGSGLRYRKSKFSKTSAAGFDHQDVPYSQLSGNTYQMWDASQYHRTYPNLNPFTLVDNFTETYHMGGMLEEMRLNDVSISNALNGSKFHGSTEKELKFKEKGVHTPPKTSKNSTEPRNVKADTSRWPFSVLHTVQTTAETWNEINCERCSSKFYSYFNFRRHFRSHNKALYHEKESVSGLREKLVSYFSKLNDAEISSLLSIEDMSFESVIGSKIISHLRGICDTENGTKKSRGNLYSSALYFMQLLDKKETKSVDLFFSELDKATERTFLIGEISSSSLRKYIFEKNDKFISNENANMSALFAFIIEQKLVQEWATNQRELALNVHQALMAEEDEKSKKLPKIQKKKRHKRMRLKKLEKKKSDSNDQVESSGDENESSDLDAQLYEENVKSNGFMLLSQDIVFENSVINKSKSEGKRSLLLLELGTETKDEGIESGSGLEVRNTETNESKLLSSQTNLDSNPNQQVLSVDNVNNSSQQKSIPGTLTANELGTNLSSDFTSHIHGPLDSTATPPPNSVSYEPHFWNNKLTIDTRNNFPRFGKGKQKKYLWEKKIKDSSVSESSSNTEVKTIGFPPLSATEKLNYDTKQPLESSVLGSSEATKLQKFETRNEEKIPYDENSSCPSPSTPSIADSKPGEFEPRSDPNPSPVPTQAKFPLSSIPSSLSPMSPQSNLFSSGSIEAHTSINLSSPSLQASTTQIADQTSQSSSSSSSTSWNKYPFSTNLKHKQKKRYQRKEYSPFPQPSVRPVASKKESKIYPVDDSQVIATTPQTISTPPLESASSLSLSSPTTSPPSISNSTSTTEKIDPSEKREPATRTSDDEATIGGLNSLPSTLTIDTQASVPTHENTNSTEFTASITDVDKASKPTLRLSQSADSSPNKDRELSRPETLTEVDATSDVSGLTGVMGAMESTVPSSPTFSHSFPPINSVHQESGSDHMQPGSISTLPVPHDAHSNFAYHPLAYSTPAILPAYSRVMPYSTMHPVVYAPSNPSFSLNGSMIPSIHPRPFVVPSVPSSVFYSNPPFKPPFFMHSNVSAPMMLPSRPPLLPHIPSNTAMNLMKVIPPTSPSHGSTQNGRNLEKHIQSDAEPCPDKSAQMDSTNSVIQTSPTFSEISDQDVNRKYSNHAVEAPPEVQKDTEIADYKTDTQSDSSYPATSLHDSEMERKVKEKENEVSAACEEEKGSTISRGNSPVFMVGSFTIPLFDLPSESFPTVQPKVVVQEEKENNGFTSSNSVNELSYDDTLNSTSPSVELSPFPSSSPSISSEEISAFGSPLVSIPSPEPKPSVSLPPPTNHASSLSMDHPYGSELFQDKKYKEPDLKENSEASAPKLVYCNHCPLCLRRLNWEKSNGRRGRSVSYVEMMTQRWDAFYDDAQDVHHGDPLSDASRWNGGASSVENGWKHGIEAPASNHPPLVHPLEDSTPVDVRTGGGRRGEEPGNPVPRNEKEDDTSKPLEEEEEEEKQATFGGAVREERFQGAGERGNRGRNFREKSKNGNH